MDSTMQTARRVRWGVLSLANIAVKAVIPAIQASRNGELTAVASRQLTRAERFAAELMSDVEKGLTADDVAERLKEDAMRAFASNDAVNTLGSIHNLPTPCMGPDEILVRVHAAGLGRPAVSNSRASRSPDRARVFACEEGALNTLSRGR